MQQIILIMDVILEMKVNVMEFNFSGLQCKSSNSELIVHLIFWLLLKEGNKDAVWNGLPLKCCLICFTVQAIGPKKCQHNRWHLQYSPKQ